MSLMRLKAISTARLFALLALAVLTSAVFASAADEPPSPLTAEGHKAVLLGYGVSHPDMGSSTEYVETAEFVLRYGRFFTPEIGRSWYRGRHELLLEVPVHALVEPSDSPMVGVNLLGCWTGTSRGNVTPYFFAGGGLVYTDAEIPGMGANLNGNYQAGFGVLYGMGGGRYLTLEYRLHHISNADTEEPNIPLNSSKLLLGISFF